LLYGIKLFNCGIDVGQSGTKCSNYVTDGYKQV